MSRLSVLLPGVSALTGPHIVAEIVADPEDAQSAGIADSFAGPAARIMSRKELLASEGGRRALDDPDVIPIRRHRRAG